MLGGRHVGNGSRSTARSGRVAGAGGSGRVPGGVFGEELAARYWEEGNFLPSTTPYHQVAVMRPMTRWSEAALSFERIPETLRRALRHCWRGRPGVVHVCVPEDVMNSEAECTEQPDTAPARYRRQEPLEPSAVLVR